MTASMQMVRRRAWMAMVESAWRRRSVVWLSGVRRGAAPAAIECKWSAGDLDPAGLRAFRSRYPRGSNFVVVADTPRPLTRHIGDLDVEVVRLEDLIAAIGGAAR